jgi:hypoxanthine phosphoribosyltransferase
MEKIFLTWETVQSDIEKCLDQIKDKSFDFILGLMRGGSIPATILSNKLNVPLRMFGIKSYIDTKQNDEITIYQTCRDSIINAKSNRKNLLIVDDLSDSGNTLKFAVDNYKYYFDNVYTLTPYVKEGTTFEPDFYSRRYEKDSWLVFPWE